ncbi:MAG: family transcriptional regulator, cyclic receptor protein [Pseudonocardiales bacterium]|jgi:CRP-like cAMP-binding protein|nr:family transcriptional regulator, cyclic receptor protein [Pseudonocardiales bacterium]
MFRNNPRPPAPIESFASGLDVRAGRVLIRAGAVGNEAMAIVAGVAEVFVRGALVGRAGPGEIVGELALLDDRPRSATVIAATDMRLLVLDRGQFAEWLHHPGSALQLAEGIARRQGATEDLLEHSANGSHRLRASGQDPIVQVGQLR